LKEKTGGPAVTAEFLKDAVGNFVLQSLMKRLCSEFTWALKKSAFQTSKSSSVEDLTCAARLVREPPMIYVYNSMMIVIM
jgi:hypothetical protein